MADFAQLKEAKPGGGVSITVTLDLPELSAAWLISNALDNAGNSAADSARDLRETVAASDDLGDYDPDGLEEVCCGWDEEAAMFKSAAARIAEAIEENQQ